MALDFPSNPVDGQVFGSYSWNASKGVWQAREESNTVAVTSPEKPTSANPGDIWVNTTTGIAFVYYDDGNTAQWMELLSSAVPSVNEIMPYGTIVQTARSTAPTGWLLCQGQAVSRTTYSNLFLAIGTTYGTGDGSTTFNIPDLQTRVPVGRKSDGTGTFGTLNNKGGFETHTLSVNEMPVHNHTQDSHSHTYSGATSGNGNHNHLAGTYFPTDQSAGINWATAAGGSYGFRGIQMPYSGDHSHTYSGTTASATPAIANNGGGLAHNNLQPYIVLNYMIKV